ncbi:hypothetical protein FQA39_LY14111 [Lamprigera yunnana]|nr:hypothetical protein FQA39_LY14111 [Lamprigera yunnana]
MSKCLTNRLQDLENEIRVLLTLQEVGTDGCQVLRGKSLTRRTDGNVEQIEFEGSNCPAAKSICQPPEPCPYQQPQCRPESAPTYSNNCYCPPQNVCCRRRPTCYCKKPQPKACRCYCVDQLQDVQRQVACLEKQLSQTEKERDEAMRHYCDLKKNCETMEKAGKAGKEEENKLKAEMEAMNRKLEEEAAKNEALEKEKVDLFSKVDKMDNQACRCAKSRRKESEQLTSSIRYKEASIRKLSQTTNNLVDRCSEKDRENQRLEECQKEALKNLLEAQCTNKNLVNQNTSLVKSIREFQDKLCSEKKCVQKLVTHLEQCRIESCRYREEAERLRARLKGAVEGPKELRRLVKLEDKLKESRQREQMFLDEASAMKCKLKELEKGQEKSNINYEEEVERLCKQNKKLQCKYEQVLRDMEAAKQDNQMEMDEMKTQYEECIDELKKSNAILADQKKQLQKEVDQLLAMSKRDRKAMDELCAKVKKQNCIIKQQQALLKQKEYQICKLRKENQALKDKIKSLEEEICGLKKLIEELKERIKDLEAQIKDLQQNLRKEKAENAKKDQDLLDAANDLENLKNVVNDCQNKLQSAVEEARLATLEAKACEQKMKEISAEMERLQTEAAEAARAKNLLSTSEMEGESVTNKHPLAPQFERKIQLMESQRELQVQLLLKQKEQAICAAKFATKNLLDTVNDFQTHVDVHKYIQIVLSHLLQEKEVFIKAMECKGIPCTGPCPQPLPRKGCGSTLCPNVY